MRIALFKHVGDSSSYRCIWQENMMLQAGTLFGYIRTSEWVDIEFLERTDSPIAEEVAQLDGKLAELKRDFTKKSAAIEVAKQNLLALTDQREEQIP